MVDPVKTVFIFILMLLFIAFGVITYKMYKYIKDNYGDQH